MLILLCLAISANAATDIPPALLPLTNDAHDQQLQRVFVPSPEQKVGEVRLLRRGNADVVQTLLYSKILKRVVGEIRKKELGNWPDGVDGHADAVRYADALEQAQDTIWSGLPKFERGADPRQKLLIEFILSRDTAVVLLAEYDMKEVNGEVKVTNRRPLSVLDLSRHYIQRNMRLIVADSFKVSDAELNRMLDALPLVKAVAPPNSKE